MAEQTDGWQASGRPLLAGSAGGPALVLDEPLSFWGGLAIESGAIVDERHPQRGEIVAGRVLVMPAGRGSSSSSSVLAEAIRRGTGPLAIVLARSDEIVVLGALVVQLLDGLVCPVLVLPESDHRRIRNGDTVELSAEGQVVVRAARALT